MTPIAVALVDDHRVVTRSLKAWLESFPDFRIVGIAASGEELLRHLTEWRPDVVLQDLLIPGGLDGIETTRRAVARMPGLKVLALTASVDEPRMIAVLRAGAVGYLRKDAEPETLVSAIRAVAHGRTYIDPTAAGAVLASAAPATPLTPRELEVMRLVALGKSNKQIAAALEIGEQTVKSHVAHVLDKLQVESRGQVVVEAIRRRLISVEDL
ncbi:MAG: response regulator transcription factor [Acidobacteria bacterium]|nr:response regulator transcription factor [Acidobacteriota bacterium]